MSNVENCGAAHSQEGWHQKQAESSGWEGDLASVLAGSNRRTHSVRRHCDRRGELEGVAVREALHTAKDTRPSRRTARRAQERSEDAGSSGSSPCEGRACQSVVSYRNSRAFREREEHIESRIRQIEQELIATDSEIENQDVQQRPSRSDEGCAGRRQRMTVDEWGGHLENILLPPRRRLDGRDGQEGGDTSSPPSWSSHSRARPSAQELGFEGDLASCLKPRGAGRDLKAKLEAQRDRDVSLAPGPRSTGSRKMPSAEELGFPTGGLGAVMRPQHVQQVEAQPRQRQRQQQPQPRQQQLQPRQQQPQPQPRRRWQQQLQVEQGEGEEERSLQHALPPHVPAANRISTSAARRAAARRLDVEQWPRRAAMVAEEWQGRSDGPDAHEQLSYEFLLSLDARIEKPGLPGHVLDSFKTVSVSKTCDESCAICLDLLKIGNKVKKLPCSHLFHRLCISKWFQSHAICPLCRHDCRPE